MNLSTISTHDLNSELRKRTDALKKVELAEFNSKKSKELLFQESMLKSLQQFLISHGMSNVFVYSTLKIHQVASKRNPHSWEAEQNLGPEEWQTLVNTTRPAILFRPQCSNNEYTNAIAELLLVFSGLQSSYISFMKKGMEIIIADSDVNDVLNKLK